MNPYLDDELVAVWQKPVAAFIAVLGAIIAIKVLKLTPEADNAFRYLKTIAFSVVGLWFFISTVSTILDHLQDVAKAKDAGKAKDGAKAKEAPKAKLRRVLA